jgi:hypothetical protein
MTLGWYDLLKILQYTRTYSIDTIIDNEMESSFCYFEELRQY